MDDTYSNFMGKVRGRSHCVLAVSCLLQSDKGGCMLLPQQVRQLTCVFNLKSGRRQGEAETCHLWLREAAAARYH